MSRLEALLEQHPMPSWRVIAWPVMIIVGAMVGWSSFAMLDEVSVANGNVVPQGSIKVIQHLEGGIVQNIFVTDGAVVRKDQPLLQLDLATTGSNLRELEVRHDSMVLQRARLEAETTGAVPVYPQDAVRRQPQQAAAERQNFDARRRQLNSSLQVLREQVKQRELEVKQLEAQQRSTASNLKITQERFRMSTSLLSEGLTAKMEHLQLEAEVENLQGQLQQLETTIPRARATVTEALERINSEEVKFRREAQEKLSETEELIARTSQLLKEAREQGRRAEIKSPIDGVVQNLKYHTIGGVVRPGEPIMEIVPTGDRLVIEAKLNPTDRGYVTEGQRATVKISTYDYARYGGLEGRVARVAPDSSTDENKMPYYRLIVETDRTYLGDSEGKLPIMPGMQATVDVHTGRKSVLEYLITPVLKLRHEAFRER